MFDVRAEEKSNVANTDNSKNIFSIEVTHNKKPDLSAADQGNPKFQTHRATSKYCSIKFIFCKICFLTQWNTIRG